jgi:hypothetical protein
MEGVSRRVIGELRHALWASLQNWMRGRMRPGKAVQEESSRAEGQMGPEESISVSLMWIACCTAAVQDRLDAAR